jgi:hypothetical protein
VTGRRRALVLAALALAVPLPALALTGGAGSGLAVSASLQGCGVANGSIVCGIDAGFSGVPEARYITASVTAPDGTVTDFGTVARGSSGSATLWVPYAGSGTYSVSASAWGVDDSGNPEVIETDQATTNGDRIKKVETSGGPRAVPAPPAADEPPAAQEPEPSPPAEPQLPPCEPAPPPAAPPATGEDPASDGSSAPDAAGADQATTEQAPSTAVTQTPGVDCAPPGATPTPPAP